MYPILNFPHHNTVKIFWLVLLAPALAADSVPRVSSIDYYGLRKISENRIQKVLGVTSGDAIPPSKEALEERLEKIPGVVLARVEAVCCEGPASMLFVGIEERGSAHFALRTAPTGEAALRKRRTITWAAFVHSAV